MERVIEFIINHWLLVSTFVALLVALFVLESQRSGKVVSPQQVINLMNKEQAIVLDVREGKDFGKGHITGAINIPHTVFPQRVDELEKYKEKPVVIVCKMGQHAGSIGKTLKQKGFANVTRLQGGVGAWEQEKLPLVK